jgi:hypothetical protein
VVARLLDALARIAGFVRLPQGNRDRRAPARHRLGGGGHPATGDEGRIDPVVLLNPRVVGESVDQDEQYEGCLSFFDVLGLVARPLLIEVEHANLAGARTVTASPARWPGSSPRGRHHRRPALPDRMPADGPLIPIEEYLDRGKPWTTPA